MENFSHVSEEQTAERVFFWGDGKQLFSATFSQLLITIGTLGLGWPWLRASIMRYMIGSIELGGSRFVFHGTGREMFRGFLISRGVILLLLAPWIVGLITKDVYLIAIGMPVMYLGLLALVPVALHGKWRYRLSRTTWRGIRMGYRGELKELSKIYYLGFFYCIITLGLYTPFLIVKLNKYMYSHARLGTLTVEYDGDGRELFSIMLKGTVLMALTGGLYSYAYYRNMLNYHYRHLSIVQDGKAARFMTKFKAMDIFELFMVNYVLVYITLGMAVPWILVRNNKYILGQIKLEEPLYLNQIQQSELIDKDASGDMLADYFNDANL